MRKLFTGAIALILGGSVIISGCKKDDDPCKIDRPKDVKPIDWDINNSVYDIYWNYGIQPCGKNDITDWGKEIMVYGWITYFPDKLYKFFHLNDRGTIPVFLYSYYFPDENKGLVDSLHSIFESADLTKKWVL